MTGLPTPNFASILTAYSSETGTHRAFVRRLLKYGNRSVFQN